MASPSNTQQDPQIRTYQRAASVVFLKTNEEFGGLSNMAGGFPLKVNSLRIFTSEALYQACRFPHRPEVQRVIIGQASPMTAKMKSKPYRYDSRSDWDQVRVKIMRWCLRVKLAQNWGVFTALLLKTGDRPIVEQSRKDDFWGAKETEKGTLAGRNVLGRLLMELRETVKASDKDSLLTVEPLAIPDFLLDGHPIQVVSASREELESTSHSTKRVERLPNAPLGAEQALLFDQPAPKESPAPLLALGQAHAAALADFQAYPAMKDSGVAWLGKVPQHWEVLPNRELFTEVKEREYPEEQMLSVTITKGITRQRTLLADTSKKDSSNQDKSAYKLVRPGDIAYNKMRAWQGAIGASAFRGIVSPAYVVQRPREGADPRYFHYLLRTPAFAKEAERWSYGITSDMWSLRPEHFKMIYGCLPPLPEQVAIVRVLDHADRRIRRYIRAKQKLLKLLEEQKQAIIHRAVTRGLDPNVRFKHSGVKWLGDVPQHWKVQRIASFSTKITNGWVGPTRDILKDVGAPYIQSLHIKSGAIRFDKKYFVATEWLRERTKIQLAQGDVVVVQTGDIGQVACVPEEFDGAGCHALIIIRTDPQVVSGEFLDLGLRSRYGNETLRSIQTGALLPHLNCTWVREIFVPVPPTSEQEKILKWVREETKSIEKAIINGDRQIFLLREYRARLIADVVTGKLDVRGTAAGLSDEPEEPEQLGEADALAEGDSETGEDDSDAAADVIQAADA